MESGTSHLRRDVCGRLASGSSPGSSRQNQHVILARDALDEHSPNREAPFLELIQEALEVRVRADNLPIEDGDPVLRKAPEQLLLLRFEVIGIAAMGQPLLASLYRSLSPPEAVSYAVSVNEPPTVAGAASLRDQVARHAG